MYSEVSEDPRLLRLNIIIVNWNTGDLLRECVASIRGASLPAGVALGSIVVIDNASHDDSLSGLGSFELPIVVIRNERNMGFGAACNQAVSKAGPSDFLLFLNPDTRLFESSLRTPLQYLLAPENSDVGIVGIQLLDETGAVARSCARFPRLRQHAAMTFGIDRIFPSLAQNMHDWPHDETREVDHVMGAFLMTRSPLFQALDGFDERFFVYLEDLDFSLRAHSSGWRSIYLSTAQAFHMGGGSSRKVMARRLFYSLRSRLQFGDKHFSMPARLALWVLTLVFEPIPRFTQLLATGRFAEMRDVFNGYRLLFSNVLFGRGIER